MAKAEFAAPHTFAFAGAYFVILALANLVSHGFANLGAVDEVLIVAVLAVFLSLLEAAFYSLGCAWGGASRPHKVSWALACGAAIALGFLIYAAIDRPVRPPANLDEAKEQYTRGTMRVAYAFLAPVLAGLISAWFSKRVRRQLAAAEALKRAAED